MKKCLMALLILLSVVGCSSSSIKQAEVNDTRQEKIEKVSSNQEGVINIVREMRFY